jgi:hypothetical protein
VSISRALPAAIPTALLCLIAGCGSSETTGQPSIPAPRRARATSSADTARIGSPAVRGLSAHNQFAAYASAVNLRAADLPGFTAAANHSNKHSKSEPELEHCVNAKEAKPLFKAKSDKLKSGGGLHTASVSSSVQIMPSIAVVRTELAKIRSALGDSADRSCLIRLVNTAFAKQDRVIHVGSGTVHVVISNTKLAPMQLGSVASTDGTFGFSLSVNVTYTVFVRGRRISVMPIPLVIDALGFASARAEVTLDTITFGREFPPELESRLFMLLVSRASAAGHGHPAIES